MTTQTILEKPSKKRLGTTMNKAEELLAKKIEQKTAKIAVVGLGYVGLPLAEAFASFGYEVMGIDIDSRKIKAINQGQSFIADVPSVDIKNLVDKNKLKAFADYDPIENADAVIICVPTPLNRAKDPDISFIVSVTNAIQTRLHKGQLIVLESTTYPGTTEEVILPSLEKSGLKAGKDFFLCFSPERIDPGNPNFKTRDIPKVVGGVTPSCSKLAASLYGKITPKVVTVSSPRTAEMAKLLENTFRIVNIGLVNELARAAETLQVNIWEAIDAAKTKPFGFMPFYPGPGIGGHCIGIDPLYLSWKARIHGADLHFIELSRRVNAEMPHYVVSQSVFALNKYAHKAISQCKVLLVGMSYKKDVSDTRESPALDILHELHSLGAKVNYHDPFVPEISHQGISLKSSPLSSTTLKQQDLVIITTNHSNIDYANLVRLSRLIYDTRNVLQDFRDNHIVRL